MHKNKLQTDGRPKWKKRKKKKKKPRKLIEENIGKIFLNPSTGFPYFCK